MKVYICILVAMIALALPAQALLGAKLALLSALKNNIGGGSNEGAYGNGGNVRGGYGTNGYANGISYNRPVYTSYNRNYGWGQQTYGGGYADGYSAGGNDQVVKVIKVIVPHVQPQAYYDNYAKSSSSANWAPIPSTIQTVQDTVDVVQPPSYGQPQIQPQYIQPSQPVYQQVTVQKPIYQQPQVLPAPVFQPLPQVQENYKTFKVIVDGDQQQHVPAQTYGPPPPATTYVAPSAGQNGLWNSGSWNRNIGTGPWKTGGIWESIGC